jgi:hypothetical protein
MSYCTNARFLYGTRHHTSRELLVWFPCNMQGCDWFCDLFFWPIRSVLSNPENQALRELTSRSKRKSRNEDENDDNSSKRLKLDSITTTTTTTAATTNSATKVEQDPAVSESDNNQKWDQCSPYRERVSIYERSDSSFGMFARTCWWYAVWLHLCRGMTFVSQDFLKVMELWDCKMHGFCYWLHLLTGARKWEAAMEQWNSSKENR